MAYSFSADAVQYSTGDAYYLRSQSGTEGPVVIDADLHVTGNLQVDKGAVFEESVHINQNLEVDGDIVSRDGTDGRVGLQLTGSPANPSVAFGDVTGSQFCALNFNKLTNSLLLIGSNPNLYVPGGVTTNAPISASSGGSGVSQMSGGGSGASSYGTLQSFKNDGTTIAPLYLQPAGEAVSLPFLTGDSLQFIAYPAVPIGSGTFTQYQLTLCGNRVIWGEGSTSGVSSYTTVNFTGIGAGLTPSVAVMSPNAGSIEDAYKRTGYMANTFAGGCTVNVLNPTTNTGVTGALFSYFCICPIPT